MSNHTATRTLVKSAPELWAECSEATSLARHLGAFGEIRITRLEPETAVAWEGDATSGTVRLEPSGWGTRVVLTATLAGQARAAAAAEGRSAPDRPAPADAAEIEAPPVGLLARIFERLGFARRRDLEGSKTVVPEAEADDAEPPEAEAEAVTEAPVGEPEIAGPAVGAGGPSPTAGLLNAALDSLGSAHHRPYSRA